MAYRSRHRILNFGALAVDTPSPTVDANQFNKGIFYFNCASTTETQIAASPDGTNWFDLYDWNGNLVKFTRVNPGNSCYYMDLVPGLMRFTPSVLGITDSWFEGIREIS